MIGEKIATRRKQLGWTQIDLARKIGIASSRISEFENGIKTDCNLSTAKRLARALGCSIDYLAETWDEDEEPADKKLAVASEAAATARPRGRPRGRPRKAAPAGTAAARG